MCQYFDTTSQLYYASNDIKSSHQAFKYTYIYCFQSIKLIFKLQEEPDPRGGKSGGSTKDGGGISDCWIGKEKKIKSMVYLQCKTLKYLRMFARGGGGKFVQGDVG